MKIKLITSYPSLNADKTRKKDQHGNPIIVFKYEVFGSKEELEAYFAVCEEQKFETYKTPEGTGLWFTTNPVGMTGELKISTNNKIYADTTAMDLANALIRQHGEVGRIMAKDLLGDVPVNHSRKTVVDDGAIDD